MALALVCIQFIRSLQAYAYSKQRDKTINGYYFISLQKAKNRVWSFLIIIQISEKN